MISAVQHKKPNSARARGAGDLKRCLAGANRTHPGINSLEKRKAKKDAERQNSTTPQTGKSATFSAFASANGRYCVGFVQPFIGLKR